MQQENRINARIDDATQAQLDELVQSTGQSVSHVVRQAIAVYHAQTREQRAVPRRLLAMVGQGRSRDGRSDVASRYKEVVGEIIDAKYALSHPPKRSRKP